MRNSYHPVQSPAYPGSLRHVAVCAGLVIVAQSAGQAAPARPTAKAAPAPARVISGPTIPMAVDQIMQFNLPQNATFAVESGSNLVSAKKADGVLMVKAIKPGKAVLSITAPQTGRRHYIIRVGADTTPPENNGSPLATDGATTNGSTTNGDTTDGVTSTPVTQPAATAPTVPAAIATPLPALSATPKPRLPAALGPIEPSAQISPNLPPPARLPNGRAPFPTNNPRDTARRNVGIGRARTTQRPAIGIQQGLARLMAFNSNILAVFFSDENVMDARAINARTLAITGKGPGQSTLAVFTQAYPNDVIGRANIYRIEVAPQAAPPTTPETPRLKDPVVAAAAIRTALDDPRVDVSVVQSPDGSLAARLTGTLRDRAEVDAAVTTARLFVPNVIPSLIVDATAPTVQMIKDPGVPPISNEAALQEKLRQITRNETIELISLPSGLVVKGEVNSPEEAQMLLRLLPPMNSPIMPLFVVRGGQSPISIPTINSNEDRIITQNMQDVTGVNTVYAVRTANNAIAISGTVRDRREYDAVRRYTQVLPSLLGAGGATATPAGATTPPVAPGGLAAEPTDTRLNRASLATAGYTMPPQIQMFVEILDPNESAIRTVTLETNLVEISRNSLRSLGVQVGSATVLSETRTAGTATTPGIVTRTIDPTLRPGTLVGGNGFAGLGPTGLIDPVRVRLDALYRNGNARILSQPNVTSVEGAVAQITVGGERPVPATSVSGGGAGTSTFTVEFRRFGVILTMRPTVSDDNTIVLQVRADVTAIDPSTSINLNGAVIPGETVRSVDTILTVREGDVIAIGGLISNDRRVETSRVPILSKIPILGELFKSKRFEGNETELAIFMQPRITRLPATAGTRAMVERLQAFPELPGRQDSKGPFEQLGENPNQR